MDELTKQVHRAQRRLTFQRFLGVLGWYWSAALLVALAVVIIDKYRALDIPTGIVVLLSLGLGGLAAALWTVLKAREPIDAAIEIDRRFALRERVSSALALSPEERQSAAGQAVLEDALRRVSRVEVRSKFAVAPGRQILFPLAPGALIVLAALLISPAVVDSQQAGQQPGVPAAKPAEVKKSAEALRRQLEERRKRAEKEGLADAERLFKKLEEGTRDLGSTPARDRKQELLKLNDVARQLQQRRDQLGGADKIKQQLETLNKTPEGPADRLAKALGRGDFKQAVNELQKLREQLAQGNLGEADREKLQKQIDQMQEKLQRLADAHQKAQENLQQQVDKLRKQGQAAEADKLQEQLDKLAQQMPQMKQLQKLAEKLGQCSKCMKNGQMQDAAEKLAGVQGEVSKLQKDADELQMMDDALEQLAQARDQMNCPECGGAGCPACQGGHGDKPGDGMGGGKGIGFRPEQKTDTAFFDSQVKQKVGRGSAVVVDMVEGPNVKGNVETETQQQVDSARRSSTDPLTGHQMPRSHRQHAREYFDRFREGKAE